MGILKFQNDDVTRKIQNARRNRRIATHEITKSKMSRNPRFLSTCVCVIHGWCDIVIILEDDVNCCCCCCCYYCTAPTLHSD